MPCLSQQTALIVPRIPALESMPAYLRERMSQAEKPCCLLWRMKRVTKADGSTKWTKVPLSAGGRGDKWDDAVDRGTYSRIKSLAASYGIGHGLGMPLGEIAAIEGEFLCGLDIDSCVDPLTGAMAPWAIRAVSMFQTYGEVSPSGSGLKLFFRMARADAEKAEGLLTEIRARYAGNANVFLLKGAVPTAGEHAPAFEIYIQKRWFALTGERYGDAKDVELISYDTVEDFILNVAMLFADKPTKEEDRARKKAEKKGTASEAKDKAKGAARPSANRRAAGFSTDEKPADWGERHISDLSREEIVARLGADDNGQWINSPGPGHSDADRTLGLILDPTDTKGFRINSLVGDDWKLCEELVMRKLGLSPSARPAPKTPEEERAAKEQKAAQEAESEALVAKKRDTCATVWNEGRTDDPRVGTYLDQWRGGLPMPPDVFKTSRSYVGKNGEICRLPDTDAEKVNIIAQIRDFKTREPSGLHVTVVEPVGDGETIIRNAKNKDGGSTRFTCGSGAGFIDLFAGGLGTRTLFCAEGHETALALLLLPLGFSDPAVRALVSSGNFTKMPPAGDKFDTIVVAADIEKSGVGLKKARELAEIQRVDGVRVLVVIPILTEGQTKRDINDIILDCRAEGRAPENGRDFEVYVIEPRVAGDDRAADLPPWENDDGDGDGDGGHGNRGGAPSAGHNSGESNTDLGNAHRLVRFCRGAIRYVHDLRSWYIWTGEYWRRDTDGGVNRLAHATVESMLHAAVAQPDSPQRTAQIKFALSSQSRKALDNMVALARDLEGVPLHHTQLDADPLLLAVKNGVINLETGEFRKGRKEDFITKRCDVIYDPSARCSNWLAFETKISNGDEKLVAFKQRMFGAALSGLFIEALFIMHGEGSNGKTTEAETVAHILGEYASAAGAPLLMAQHSQKGASPELVALKGRRAVFINETEENDTLNEARVKCITSNALIPARELFQSQIEFMPTHKPFLQTNHKPRIRGTDLGIWRRLFYVPYTVTIRGEDKVEDFRERMLVPEASGILNWMLQGCRAWLADGRNLRPPPCVLDAAAEYRKEQNTVALWAERFIALDPACEEKITLATLHGCYSEWMRREYGWKPVTKNRLSAELEKMKFVKGRANDGCTAFTQVRVVLPFLEPPAPKVPF